MQLSCFSCVRHVKFLSHRGREYISVQPSKSNDVSPVNLAMLLGSCVTSFASIKLNSVKPVQHCDSTASAASSLNSPRCSVINLVIAAMGAKHDDCG